jgi:hypothetical protein
MKLGPNQTVACPHCGALAHYRTLVDIASPLAAHLQRKSRKGTFAGALSLSGLHLGRGACARALGLDCRIGKVSSHHIIHQGRNTLGPTQMIRRSRGERRRRFGPFAGWSAWML